MRLSEEDLVKVNCTELNLYSHQQSTKTVTNNNTNYPEKRLEKNNNMRLSKEDHVEI